MKRKSSFDTIADSSELSSGYSKGKLKNKMSEKEEEQNEKKGINTEYGGKEKKKNDKKKNESSKDKKGLNNKKQVIDMYKNKFKFLVDNIIVIGIILSFVILISFKYLEEKYSIESYFEDGDNFDYYEVLKCKRGDSIQKIKKSYRDLSKMYHPDSNKDCKDCDKKFREITKAYKTLSDARLKKAYDNSQGKVLKIIESNSVNLNLKNYTDLVENSNDFWIIQIYSDTDNLSLSFSKIWEESFDKYNEHISFGRINILTDKKLVKNKIPFNVKIYPTIFILSPDGSYQLYSNIFNATTKDFQNFIINYYPNYIYNLVTFNQVYDFSRKSDALNSKGGVHIDKNNEVILLTNKKKLSLQAKHITYKFNSIYKTFSIKYDEIKDIKNETLKNEIIEALKVLSVKKDEYLKENENIDYFLLVNNINQVKVIRRISATNIKNVYNDALRKNFVEINSTNIDSVCSTVGSRHIYCYVIIVDKLNNEQTVNYMKKIYQHINNSFTTFTAKLGTDDIDGQFFIQPVYILKNNITNNFKKFVKEKSITMYDSFFLDYSSNTFAPINEIKNLSNYSQKKEDLSFLSNIYKDIEILNFEKIPTYCLPVNINCLYNVKRTFSYRLYNIFRRTSKTQIIVSAIVGIVLYPSFKQYGKMKYVFLTLSVGASIFVTSMKDFFLLLAN
ncbi:DnaJ protein [Plasmodium brasilianum]|uniref:DnaJ protein, putative n=2 Tax=Plasmodium (Plasmodium) TaxID=418103 RepID=A0A1A8WU91_PLAMA|nr:DnaJ protein, putative [Plasmodium malariae]KAI4839991.1 DnaJ protein [Plasmodium brasilianum]SBS94897.1 DnaJ protein, putative [Plasmodium malariae]SBT87359.1 DnaJ protein, putative [Plasmodium malariae]